jgi:K+-sensing histidine kinase KdpD
MEITGTSNLIPRNEEHLLFKPLSKLNAGKNSDGRGLGLYVSKQIVEKLQGKIDFT